MTIYHLLKLFQTETDIMLGKKSLVVEFYDELVSVYYRTFWQGAQWLSGRLLDSRPRGRGFEPHLRHCVVVLEQDTLIPA